MQAQNTGWRQAAAINVTPYPSPIDGKEELFSAARMCCQALKLPSSCRFVLDQLCAAYRGEPVEGRLLVWPSNAWLETRTGIPERSIRFALRRLIDMGVITAKDSPNGKRYARRGPGGQIIAAYGFDLGPLASRMSEFKDRLVAIQERERECRAAFDEITVTRRNAQELLGALLDAVDASTHRELTERFQALSDALPRRSRSVMPREALELWKTLYRDMMDYVSTGKGGDYCRHKDTNKDTPEIPCNNGGEVDDVAEVARHCPDATALLGGFRFEWEMFEQADRYRGMLGVSQDAWLEAMQVLGKTNAAKLLYLVTQIQAKPRSGAQQIRNFGGYFRALMRKIAEGAVDLDAEISRRGQ